MKTIFSAFEDFAVRAFNIRGRATLLDYWCVMPFIWALILWLLIGDIQNVYAALVNHQVPPMNPLFYSSFVVFALTFIPRTTLTIRRLHDSNKSGFWFIIPMICFVSICFTATVLVGSMLNSSLTGVSDDPDSVRKALDTIMTAIVTGTFWQEMFSVAAAFEKAGSDALWGLLSEIYAQNGQVDIRRFSDDVNTAIDGESGHTMAFFMVSTALASTPFLSALGNAIMTLLPTDPRDNIYGPAKMAELNYRRAGEQSKDPMAGYAHLFEKTDEEKEVMREMQKQQIKDLYRSRVLKEPPAA